MRLGEANDRAEPFHVDCKNEKHLRRLAFRIDRFGQWLNATLAFSIPKNAEAVSADLAIRFTDWFARKIAPLLTLQVLSHSGSCLRSSSAKVIQCAVMAGLIIPSTSTKLSQAVWTDTARSVIPINRNLPRIRAPDLTALRKRTRSNP